MNLILLLSLLYVAHVLGSTLSYQRLRQKSSHNSYQRLEGLQDQLQYHRIRSLELDIYYTKSGHTTNSGDWFVYHNSDDTGTTCHRLSDCLKELQAWSNANPNHEVVTVWVDIKDSNFGSNSGDTPEKFDDLINQYLDVYEPGDILNGA